MVSVFISYSKTDSKWKDALVRHLSVLEGDISWTDSEIGVGQDWFMAIDNAIDEAKVAVLLVSSDFLGTDFIRNHEIPKLLEKRERGLLTIYPIIVRPCAWMTVDWLAQMQFRPPKGKSLSEIESDHDCESAFAEMVTEIAALLGLSNGWTAQCKVGGAEKKTSAVELEFDVDGLSLRERFVKVPYNQTAALGSRAVLVQQQVMPDTSTNGSVYSAARGSTWREVQSLLTVLQDRYRVPFRLLSASEWKHIMSGGQKVFPPAGDMTPVAHGAISRRSRANVFGVHLTPPRLYEFVDIRLANLQDGAWAFAAAAVPGCEPEQVSLDIDESDMAVVFRLALDISLDISLLNPSWEE